MQLVSSRIWKRVAVSISYDDNHYTTGSSYIFIANVIAWLEFELSNFDLTVQHFSHYVTRIPPQEEFSV